ncbi:MAG: tetratricopeptide repeat protein [Ktedonobacterales bacterium]|nr:tetratricopeptide repeat protein [Ktedonobacteraceae bacterium]MBA3822833.1 tetratricopeptide repeat protein [Ktedonobacterales bacterium]
MPSIGIIVLIGIIALLVVGAISNANTKRRRYRCLISPFPEVHSSAASNSTAPVNAMPWTTDAGLRIFLSHSSSDNSFGFQLAADLRHALGGEEASVWYDAFGGLQAGDLWPERIERELSSRDIFLLLLSPKAIASKWVQDELRMAWMQKNSASGESKVIIPLLLAPCEVPAYLAMFQFVSFVSPRPYVEALAELLQALRTSRSRTAQMEQRPLIPVGLPFDESLLPVPPFFIGREADLAWTMQHMRAGGTTAITALEGLGGIGKTALAAVAIQQLRRDGAFPDGIVVVLCQDLVDPAEILIQVLTRFDPYRKAPQEVTLADLARRATHMLKGKRALVVLDNVEPRLPIATVISPFQTAELTLLLTARQALSMEIVPHGSGRILDLLSPEEALELFAWALGRKHADALNVAEHAAAVRIVAALGRHTLAVRLAGAYASNMGRDLAVLASELEHDPLEVPGETPRGVALILSRSTAALPEGSRQLFAGSATFAAPEFGRQAALTLAQGLGQVNPQTNVDLLVVRALAEKSFSAGFPEKADRERLRLHPLVRAFAMDLLLRWPEREQYLAAFLVAQHFATYADDFQADYPVLAMDERNLTGALEWAQAHEQRKLIVALAFGMRLFWDGRARYQDGLSFLPQAIAAAKENQADDETQIPRLQLAELQLVYGRILMYSGQLVAGEAILQQGLGDFRREQDRRGEEETLTALGDIEKFRGHYEEAKGYLQRSLTIADEIGDRQNKGVVLSILGHIALRQGHYDTAESYLQQALIIRHEIDDRQGEGVDLGTLGQVELFRGQPEAAENYLQQSLLILREIGDRSSEGAVLGILGQVALRRGQFAVADEYLQQGLAIIREIGDRQDEASQLSVMGQVALRRGRYAEAEKYLQQSLAMSRDIGDRHNEGVVLSVQGQKALRCGQYEAAESLLRQILAIRREVESLQGEGVDLSLLGQVALQHGQYEVAEHLLHQALDTHLSTGDRRWEARTKCALGHLAEARDDVAQADIWYRSSLTLAIERMLGPECAEAQFALGCLLSIQHIHHEEGCLLLREAARVFNEMGLPEAEEARVAVKQFGCADAQVRVNE